MTSETPDGELVAATLNGNRAAFGELVRRHRRAAVARARSVLIDSAEADDVAQESFVQAYERLGDCRDPGRFGAWLGTIVKHRALNRLRTIRRRGLVALDDTVPDQRSRPPDAGIEQEELRRRLTAALARLRPIEREVVLLADLEDWSHAEIAEATGLSVLMSRRHLSTARSRLRLLLAEQPDPRQGG